MAGPKRMKCVCANSTSDRRRSLVNRTLIRRRGTYELEILRPR